MFDSFLANANEKLQNVNLFKCEYEMTEEAFTN